ncbi:hypothetical protein [Photobacterium leiognathi]|uniref:hypothetical protein n=1 Tax=Photobacterium leiognathi TaxID=553611 RepID=UPI002981207F|nr:hypothetical protein [Photobacterium leiognathi]
MAKTYKYFAVFSVLRGFKSLSYEAKRNILKQCQFELDNTGDFKRKSLLSIQRLEESIIVIPFRSLAELIEYRNRLADGMHPSRYSMLRIIGKRKSSILNIQKKMRNGKVTRWLKRVA